MKESRFAWVYKGEQSKQVLLDEVNQHILDGWIKGRPTKFSIPEDEIRDYMEKHMTYEEIGNLLGMSKWTVMGIARSYGLRSDARRYQQIMDNCSKSDHVRKSISDGIREHWSKGTYKNRINGMLGVTSLNHPNFHAEPHYREKLLFYTPCPKCVFCNKPIKDGEKYDVHHIDENRENNILSNLAVAHVSCHQSQHVEYQKQPFAVVTKIFTFPSSHMLPEHERKCKFVHGHTYKLEVSVRRRIHPRTGFVVDFGDLGRIVKENVIELWDHEYINRYIEMPTSENMIYWIWEQLSLDLKGLHKLVLWESEETCVEITSKDVLEYVSGFKLESEWFNDDKVINEKLEKSQNVKMLREFNNQ